MDCELTPLPPPFAQLAPPSFFCASKHHDHRIVAHLQHRNVEQSAVFSLQGLCFPSSSSSSSSSFTASIAFLNPLPLTASPARGFFLGFELLLCPNYKTHNQNLLRYKIPVNAAPRAGLLRMLFWADKA